MSPDNPSASVNGDATFTQKLMSAAVSRKEQKRFVKFAIVGTIGALVDFGVLSLLVYVFAMPELFANMISVASAIISNFFWNRYWSFPESKSRPLRSQFTQYALINMAGWVFNQLIFASMFYHVMPLFHIGRPFDLYIPKLTAIAVVLFWNFGLNRLTTYRGL
ncbi:MAG: GtrA family protein [Anaerolineales bacterium]|nr:GtrA family protein [Anaerolineales bacterium]MCB9127550.1 GtrA family protein [Ardenticatenales bacterium]